MNSIQKNKAFLILFVSVTVFLLCYNVINAEEKIKIMEEVGISMAKSPADIGKTLLNKLSL